MIGTEIFHLRPLEAEKFNARKNDSWTKENHFTTDIRVLSTNDLI